MTFTAKKLNFQLLLSKNFQGVKLTDLTKFSSVPKDGPKAKSTPEGVNVALILGSYIDTSRPNTRKTPVIAICTILQ